MGNELDGLRNNLLDMTVAEQREALLTGGFSDLQLVATAGSLVVERGRSR